MFNLVLVFCCESLQWFKGWGPILVIYFAGVDITFTFSLDRPGPEFYLCRFGSEVVREV